MHAKNWLIAGWGIILISLPACSRSPGFSGKEWNVESSEPRPQPTSLSAEKSQAQIGTQKVEFVNQAVAGVPLEGTFVKTLSDTHGNPVWLKTQYLADEKLPTPKVVQAELTKRDRVNIKLDRLQVQYGCRASTDTAATLQWRGTWQVVFKRICEMPSGEAYILVVNSRGRLISHDPAGAQLTMTTETSTLYPKGPKFSVLKPLNFNVSTTPGFLMNPHVTVVSDSAYEFSTLGQIPQIAPTEDRFDMVQAYYYASQALDWVSQNLKYEANDVKIRTNVGYPQRSNIAFYFGGEVRIGTGDDVSYSRMALDPSIVIHETMHGVIEPLTRLPFQGEGGSLQEGLADTLTALQLDSPNMGEQAYKAGPFTRTLANDSKLQDKSGGLYHDSLILSGLVWEIRSEIDSATALDLAKFLLAHFAPNSNFADAQAQVTAWLNQVTDADKAVKARAILQKRGWM